MIRMGSIVLWLCLIVTGLSGINFYTASPGQSDEAVFSWPKDSRIEAKRNAPQLLVFIHPHCPCSRSTVRELERVLALAPHVRTMFVVFSDQDADSSWHKSELINHAEQLSCVHVDQGGKEASRFGVRTSGHVLLFDLHGKCVFSGGVTAGRGHEGDGPGKLALLDILFEHGATEPKERSYAVFGCSLQRLEEEG